MASSGEDSASDAHHGPTTTMRRRRCLRRRMHNQAMRRSSSTEKNPTEVPSTWPFWWLGAAAIAVFVTPGLSPAIFNPEQSMHDMAMGRLWGAAGYGQEQRWWMDRNREDKMIFQPNYDDEHFFDAFKKPRPQGVRYRDDATLHRIAMQQLQQTQAHVYPVVVQDRPRHEMMEQGESSSSGPSLVDIDLIDVLWRQDIESEKNGGAAVAPGVGLHPSDQVERDLQLLTEKSVQAPLTLEESSRYEDLSKCYFEDFYSNRRFAGEFSASGKSVLRGSSSSASASTSSSSCSPTSSTSTSAASSSSQAGEQRSRAASGATAEDEDVKPSTPLFDSEVEALFEDLGKPCGELNMLMPTEGAGMGCPINTGVAPPTTQPVQQQPQLQHQTVVGYTGPMPTADTLLQNVSLATIAPYNPANLTELDFMVRDGTLSGANGTQQMVLPPLDSLSAPNGTNGFPAPTQFWFESAPDGTASYQSRQPVLNMSTLQLPPLVGLGEVAGVDLQQAAAAAADDINMPPAHHELTTLTGRMPHYETRPSVRTASMSSTSNNETQSLGAGSSSTSSSSSSPHYSSTSTQGGAGSDGENRSPRSRFYGKLAPAPMQRTSAASISLFDDDEVDGDANGFFRSPGASLLSHSGGLNSAVAPRRRGRQSKDEQLAATNGLPVSAAEIADMSLPDLQKLLKADSLTEPQRQLIRKIRRRGKNKVAARTCRQRRGVARTEHSGGYEAHSPRVLGYSNRH